MDNLQRLYSKLLASKSDEREGLAKALKGKDTLAAYLRQNELANELVDLDRFTAEPIAEEDFINMTYGLGERLHSGLELNDEEACHLVFRTSHNESGGERLENLERLKGNSNYDAELQEMAKHFLRRLCGYEKIRGIRDLYSYCPLAATWWKYHIINNVSKQWARQAFEAIDRKSWPSMAERIVSGRSVIGSKNVRDGIILFAACGSENAKQTSKATFWRAIEENSPSLGQMPPQQVCNFLKGKA